MEIDQLKNQVVDIVKDIDDNNDEKVTISELVDYVAKKIKRSPMANLSIANEYLILYAVLIFGVIGYFIPNLNAGGWRATEWIPVVSIAMISGNIIYGGLLKNNFQKKLNLKESEQREMSATLDANKDALTKSTLSNQQITIERNFWKSRYEEEIKKKI